MNFSDTHEVQTELWYSDYISNYYIELRQSDFTLWIFDVVNLRNFVNDRIVRIPFNVNKVIY
jgi:hypothetical protein